VWGGFLVKAEHISTPENSQGSRALHSSQLQQPLPTLRTHRTSGLMISRPGGRGYKARILSHKARSHGSTTASGLQVGHWGCRRAAPSLQAQELLPLPLDSAGLSLGNHLCSPSTAQSLHAVTFQLQVWERVSATLSSHSHFGAQPNRPANPRAELVAVTGPRAAHSLCPVGGAEQRSSGCCNACRYAAV